MVKTETSMRDHRFCETAFSAATAHVLLFGGIALTCGAIATARHADPSGDCVPEATVAAATCLLRETAQEIRQETRFRGPNPLRSTAGVGDMFRHRRGTLHIHFAS